MNDGGVYLFSVRSLKTVVDMFPGSAAVHTDRAGDVDPRGSWSTVKEMMDWAEFTLTEPYLVVVLTRSIPC